MELNNRIHYDSAELLNRIEVALDRLKPYQYDSKYRELLGEYLVDKLSDWERNIRQRKNDPFTLVVCGEFKRGKSSLINALLGEDITPVNVTPETVTLNRISYGIHQNEAILSGGRRLTLTDEELERSALEKLMAELGEPIVQLHMTRPIELLKDITIIDTPGLNDAEKDFSEEVGMALRQADAVIYSFTASYPLSRTEQLFLKSVILPQKYTSLFLVSNFSDIMRNEKELSRMTEVIKERINDLLPNQKLYMISALDERCRQLEEERPNEKTQELLADAFDTFRTEIQELIQNKRDTVLPDRMERMLRLMTADINDNLSVLESGLDMDEKSAQEATARLVSEQEQEIQRNEQNTQKIREIAEQMKNETTLWMDDVLSRMKGDLSTLPQYATEDIIKNYPIFCLELLQNAMGLCVDYHTEKLMDALDTISEELSQAIIQQTGKQSYNIRFSLHNRTWTKGDNVSYIGTKFSNGLFYIAATAIGGAMRQKEIKDNKPQIIQSITGQYDSLYVSVHKEIDKTYQNLAVNASKVLTEYYSEKKENLQCMVEQISTAARQDESKKDEIRAAAAALRTLMEEFQL